MKLEPVFTVKDNKLYKIADNSLVDITTLNSIEVSWSKVEIEDESYNEEFLAKLREDLKHLDDLEKFAILVPVVDKPLENENQVELFINAFNHTARRIKDCISVAGIKLPEEIIKSGFTENSPAETFMATLTVKHAQYVYFATKTDSVDYSNTENKVVLL